MDMLERLYQTYLQSRQVTTDSRQITPGCIFFAFRGETFDGNAFAPQALEQGAALCVISDPQYKVDDRCIVVPDVLDTLQQLAAHHRRQLAIPFLGITGTNGKTTTKELVHAVLAKRYRTHATSGNFNNHLGVPLTILAIPADAQIAIIEMGASHPGEIADLCRIADPDFGLITNVGRAHLEGFGSFEGVIQTKTELYRHLSAKEGTAFVNADNDILTEQAAQCGLKTVTYGCNAQAQVRGTLVGSDPYLHFYFEVGDNVYNVRTHLLGNYNFDNCMAATAVGCHFRVEPWDIKEAIEQYEPSNKRSQYKQTARNTLFLDCYNANPSSMKVALDNLEALPMPNKMAILGSMRELGAESANEHKAIADRLADSPIQAILVGEEFGFVADNPAYSHLQWFPDVEAAKASLRQTPPTGCTILLKGSNSTRMWLLEEVL